MSAKQYSTLDHLKQYITLTQQAKVALANGSQIEYAELFNQAEAHLKQVRWDSLILSPANDA